MKKIFSILLPIYDVGDIKLCETVIDNSKYFKVAKPLQMAFKTFIHGTQFHPEVVVNRAYKMQESDICNADTWFRFFESLVDYSWQKSKRNTNR